MRKVAVSFEDCKYKLEIVSTRPIYSAVEKSDTENRAPCWNGKESESARFFRLRCVRARA